MCKSTDILLYSKIELEKRGGGAGFYVKEQLQYKVRTDLTQNYTDLEILVVEIRVRNKNTPTLVCAVYQPSSIEVEKLEWLEKFEQFLANIYTTWNVVLILNGDFNINLLSHQNESTNRCKNILHTFSLQQHVTKTTRKGKTLIDHISSNISTKLILITLSALMKFQTTMSHMRYSILKKNAFKNDTNMYEMRKLRCGKVYIGL